MTKITVIIPIFNGEKYIESCVDNLLKQTLSDFEIILINDGSTDGTKKICNELKEKDFRIKVIHQDNTGVSNARNKGIKSALGEYLCFIDCDDDIDNDYLEVLYDSCINNKVKMSACTIDAIKENRELISFKKLKEGKYNYKKALYELFRFKDFNSGPCGKLMHKSLFEDNLKFPNIHTYEDLLFVYKAIYKSKEIYFTNKCKYYYLHRDGIGAMVKFIKNPTTDVIVAANEILEFIKERVPEIWDSSFYGIISQVIMYINDINSIDPKWKQKNSKIYIKETKNILRKYRKEIIKNRTIFFKEKVTFIIFSYSSIMYRYIGSLSSTLKKRRISI